jgi:hypothetical protein
MIIEIALGIVLAVIILVVILAKFKEIVDVSKFIVSLLLSIFIIYLVRLAFIKFLPLSVNNFIGDAIVVVIISCLVIFNSFAVYLVINSLINTIKSFIKYIKIRLNRRNNERK